jgi:hypothetical protein
MQTSLHQRWDCKNGISCSAGDCSIVMIGAVEEAPRGSADASQAFPPTAFDCSVPRAWFPGQPFSYFEAAKVVIS